MIDVNTYSTEEVGLAKEQISANAISVVEAIQKAGYSAYLVGGCVRDLVLGLAPKDFDVATDARPEQIKKIFKNSRIIGRRFKLVHVRFGREVIEVATFRASAEDRESVSKQESSESVDGQLLRDNVYGSIDEDAQRRDFTVNALYYDPVAEKVLDYASGLEDIKNKQLKSIGDPNIRFKEDPVRMLRAIRFSSKLGFGMEQKAIDIIESEGAMLSNVSSARLFDEVLKLFHGGAAYDTFFMLRKYGLFKLLFPFTDHNIVEGEQGMPEKALLNTDKRVNEGKPVIPAFLFACMMWDPIKADAQVLMHDGLAEVNAWRVAMKDGLRDQNQYVAVPKRLAEIITDIWEIHFRLIKRNPSMVKNCLNSRRFRAAYDFLLLRTSLHEVGEEIVQWWTKIQECDDAEKENMIIELGEIYRANRQKRNEHGEANGNSVNYHSNHSQHDTFTPHSNTYQREGAGPNPKNKTGRKPNKRRFSDSNTDRRNKKSSKNSHYAKRRNAYNGDSSYNSVGNRPNPSPNTEHYAQAEDRVDNENQKKVKVRKKRKVIQRPIKAADESPHF